MSEKLAEVFEQYDMEILSSKKGRGATIVTTPDGVRILEPFRGNITRLEQEYVLKQLLAKQGCTNIDSILPNTEGQLLTCDKYRQPFVMKEHFEGTECDMHEGEDIVRSIKVLAKFHVYGQQVLDDFEDAWKKHLQQKELRRMEEIRLALENGEELEKLSSLYEISEKALEQVYDLTDTGEEADCNFMFSSEEKNDDRKKNNSVANLFQRHNQEIKKIQRYIMKVKRKNDFETLYLKVYGDFYEKGRRCLEMLSDTPFNSENDTSISMNTHYGICHGSFNQHNIILGKKQDAIVHFERFSKGNQLNDLYQFARKVMEKNHFDYTFLELIFQTYEQYIPLTRADYQYMYILFSYPEKFWKIANSYYNTNKAFLSPKYIEKMNTVILQEEEKQTLLETYREKNILFN